MDELELFITQRVKGIASRFGNVDLDDDTVLPGAFLESIAKTGGKVPLYWQHDHFLGPGNGLPVGHTTMLRESEVGLEYEGLIVNTTKGGDLVKLLGAGSVGQSSFAYDILDWSVRPDGVRELKRLDLHEVSVTVRGVNPDTSAGLIKSDIRLIESKSHDFLEALDFVMNLQALDWALQGA